VPPATPVPTVIPLHVKGDPLAGVVRLAPQSPPPPPAAEPSPVGPLTVLPSDGARRFALTVDDGVSTEVLEAYVDFVIATGMRMTFFVNGVYDSWRAVRAKLAPLVDSGQVQLGNHTWNHPSITGLSDSAIADQVVRNERFLLGTYGVTGQPYFRPPYGNHDERTDRVTDSLGYPRVVMWYGSLGDSSILTPAQILANARQWFVADRIVIGHANHPSVSYVYPQLAELIRTRRLQTVTLHDVFGPAT
jgi:peptidoglycan/xylan/chitin deacetylase (PgdA/CDA1 family)